MVENLIERLRDHARDNLCLALQALGVQAQLFERGNSVEEITSNRNRISLGAIGISASPIQWITIEKEFDDGATWAYGGFVTYTLHYGISDPKIKSEFPKVHIESKLIRKFRPFGKVIGLQWKGKDFGLGLVDCLNGDTTLDTAIITTGGYLDIKAHTKHGCWTLTNICNAEPPIPSLEQWECYQTIARHLLGISRPISQ